MKRIRRWLQRLALGLPQIQALTRRANRAIEASDMMRSASQVERLMEEEVAIQWANLKGRMGEMLAIRRAEVACVNPEKAEAFAESYATPPANVTQFKERLWELELALEDRGWVREVTLSNLEFSRLGIQQLCRICRIYALKNPLIKRGAIICRLYTFGRGVEIRADDDTANKVIQTFLEDNKAEMGHTGLASKEQDIQTDGSLYWGLKTDPKGNVRVIQIDPLEIMDVATDPDDTSVPQFFLRMWTRENRDMASGVPNPEPMRAWYPSVQFAMDNAKRSLTDIGGVTINWDMPIYRSRDSETPSKWRWAVPPLYASLDWARAYKDFLEDWATIQRSLSRFALMVETKGGQTAIAAYQALLSTTFADSGGTQIEQNPPPNVGSAHISGPGTTITPFKSNNASTAPEQARRLLLMNAAAQGLPETFYGDASTGSLATAMSLDRPTELKFTEIQRRWKYDITCILGYVLFVSKTTPGGVLREARNNNPAPQPVKIIVKFPNVVEHNILNQIQAICDIASMGGRTGIAAGIVDRRTIAALLLEEIGIEDVDELLNDIYGKKYKPADDVTDQRSQPAPQMISTPLGKALTDLSTPPPLPAPPPPTPIAAAPPLPGAKPPVPGVPPAPKPAAKEAVQLALNRLREAATRLAATREADSDD